MKTWGAWERVVKFAGLTIVGSSFIILGNFRGSTTRIDRVGMRVSSTTATEASGLSRTKENRRLVDAYGKLPLSFEENQGQTAREVRYVSRGAGYELFLTPQEAVLALRPDVPCDLSPRRRTATMRAVGAVRPAGRMAVVRMQLEGANPAPGIAGINQLPGKTNYFVGNDPKKWHTDVPSYARVRYEGVYPGVDLVFYGNQRRLEFDFIVRPGADPKSIRLSLDGAERLRVDGHGDLIMTVSGGEVVLQKPVVYQLVKGQRHEVPGDYVFEKGHQVTLSVATYDRNEPLIFDPVLNYSTYLGGSTTGDSGSSITVDSLGDAFLTGTTFSTTFPTKNGFGAGNTTGVAFVTELNPAGTQLVYSTYLGGSGGDSGRGIALDPSGNVYVTGQTHSTDFPTTSNGLKPGPNAGATSGTSFISKINPAVSGMNSLVYSSYLGGTAASSVGDLGSAIAADASGNAYVTGFTASSPGSGVANFPITTTNAFQTTLGTAAGNSFVTRIDTTQSGSASLIYSTYLGGSGANATTSGLGFGEFGLGVAVDSSKNAYVTGTTTSADFPTTTTGFQTKASPPAAVAGGTVFVSRIDTTKTGNASLIYSTYVGGNTSDFGLAIALKPSSAVAYVTGTTSSTAFPTFPAGAYQTTGAGGSAFVSLIDTGQIGSTSLKYSTFLGGGGTTGFSIQSDTAGNAYVGGGTQSVAFPRTAGAFQPSFATGAAGEGFITKLNPGGNGAADLIYSTFFGGSGSGASGLDSINSIAVDSSNPANAYVTGQTFSSSTFPIFPNPGAFQTTLNGTSDAFIAKLTPIPTLVVAPTSLNFGTILIPNTSAAKTVTLTNNTNAAIAFTSAVVNGSPAAATTDYMVTNSCSGSIPFGASNTCTVSVTFKPTVVGAETATLQLTDSDSTSPQNIALSGTGANPTPAVMLAPTTLTFSSQLLNTTSAAQTVTLTNTGTGPLTIISIAASGDFAETSTGATACPISPATLPATAGSNTCMISVTFTPTMTGTRTGTLTIMDNAAGSPHTVALTGTGSSTPPDFTLSAAPTTVTVAQGGVSSPVTITVNPTNGFNSAVALTCTGTPTYSSCALSPTSITPPTTSSLTFTAHGMFVPSSISKPAPPLNMLRIVPLFVALMLLYLMRSTQRLGTRLAMVSAIFVCATIAACSGSYSPPSNYTAKGTYTLTVTGTSGTLTHNATVTVTVN